MNRRRFLRGTRDGLFTGILTKIGISPKEPEPSPVDKHEDEVPKWKPNSGSAYVVSSYFVYGDGTMSENIWRDEVDWGINASHPRCHYCHKYIVRGRDACPHCGGEYRITSNFT